MYIVHIASIDFPRIDGAYGGWGDFLYGGVAQKCVCVAICAAVFAGAAHI